MDHDDAGRPRRTARATHERRPRRDARAGLEVAHSAELGWISARGRSTSAAILVDLTAEGLIVLADGPVRDPDAVCLRLTWPLATPWIAVNVIERRQTRIGPVQLRLAPRRRAEAAALATLAGLDPVGN